ncbi:MAG: glycosyltransferase family 9 protein [Woeseiaceae bacterium]|nr:glycosyltransferase family 9 protein [Woeseiaceae bacterium]
MLASQPDTICVVRLSAIGDTCHALAVVRRLQDNWPGSKITWIIGRTEAALMAGIEGVEFIIFDKSAGLSAYRDIRRQLKGRSFDVALCMHASMRANILYPLIDSPLRLGFDKSRARDFQWLFTNKRIPVGEREHAMEAMMGFATATGAQETPLRWDIPVGDEDRAIADDLASQHGRLAVISPCTSNRARNFRNWPADRFVHIAHFLEQRGLHVVLTGGPTDVEQRYGTEIAAACRATNLIGKTSLKQLIAVFAAAELVICPDSGPAHMATAAGVPVVGLYATSNPDRTGPYLSRQWVANRYPDALRQYLGFDVDEVRWGQRVRNPDAMAMISVDDVAQKIDDLLSEA